MYTAANHDTTQYRIAQRRTFNKQPSTARTQVTQVARNPAIILSLTPSKFHMCRFSSYNARRTCLPHSTRSIQRSSTISTRWIYASSLNPPFYPPHSPSPRVTASHPPHLSSILRPPATSHPYLIRPPGWLRRMSYSPPSWLISQSLHREMAAPAPSPSAEWLGQKLTTPNGYEYMQPLGLFVGNMWRLGEGGFMSLTNPAYDIPCLSAPSMFPLLSLQLQFRCRHGSGMPLHRT